MYSQDHGLNYYVFNSNNLPEPKKSPTKVDTIAPELDKFIDLYFNKLLSFEQISQKTGVPWWTLKQLFKQKGIKTISLSQRANLKRNNNRELLYKLYIIDKLSLKQIYSNYKFSPPYARRVLKEFFYQKFYYLLLNYNNK